MSRAHPTSVDELSMMLVYTLVLRLVAALVALTAPPWCQSFRNEAPEVHASAGSVQTSICQCYSAMRQSCALISNQLRRFHKVSSQVWQA